MKIYTQNTEEIKAFGNFISALITNQQAYFWKTMILSNFGISGMWVEKHNTEIILNGILHMNNKRGEKDDYYPKTAYPDKVVFGILVLNNDMVNL